MSNLIRNAKIGVSRSGSGGWAALLRAMVRSGAGARLQNPTPPRRGAGVSSILAALLLGFVLLLPFAGSARADTNGVIYGELTKGTPDGPDVAGVEVRLFLFKGQQEDQQAQRVATSDANGAFRFEGLDTSDTYTYQVGVNYAGLPYGTDGLKFNAGESEKHVTVEVYDVTQENPGVYANSASFMLLAADPETESALALEMTELVNPGNKAYQPSPGGPAGPMNLVRFSLPAGATDLTAHIGMADDEVFQVDRGFATTAVILPGTHEFMYTYRFPYKDGKATFTKNLWYGAKVFTLLAAENVGDLTVPPTLTPGDTVDINGQKYRQWNSKDLSSGAALDIAFNKLPEPSGFRLPFRDQPGVGYSGLGVLVALAAFAALLLVQRRLARRPAVAAAEGPSLPEGEIGEYLTALAELDDRFMTGQVPESEYERQRDALKDDLKDLLRERDLQLAAPGAASET